MEINKMVSLMVEKGYLSEETMEKVLADEDFQKKRKERKKKTSEERRGQYDPDKCQARVWKEGHDNIQCSFSKLDKGCLCKKHQTCSDKDEGWWLGMIREKRPEKPIWRGVEHFWNTDVEGNEILKKEKKTEEAVTPPEKKKTRGRPKGSKNKKKVKETKVLSVEEILVLLEKKKEEDGKKELPNHEEVDGKEELPNHEEEVDGVEDEPKKYLVDGVPYEMNGEEIMDPEDFSPIGVKDGNGGITFEDDDAKEKHLENAEKYST